MNLRYHEQDDHSHEERIQEFPQSRCARVVCLMRANPIIVCQTLSVPLSSKLKYRMAPNITVTPGNQQTGGECLSVAKRR